MWSKWLPPSRELLFHWLDDHGIYRSDALAIVESPDSGWGVKVTREMEVGEIICQIPKTALLSARTTSLPQLIPLDDTSATSHTIFYLALVVLHEIRLGPDSAFWGYIQSLPRETVMLPVCWRIEELGGEDGRLAWDWLKGTAAERDLLRKDADGMSLEDLKQFYIATSPHLPPTQTHPQPSPFLAYLHAYSLVCTRAFIIDLYHTVALCPFADLFNHSSSNPHSSLASDDFVCHLCGSLAPCSHDIMSTSGVVRRLEHLPGHERSRLEKEIDNVEMKVERWVNDGEEIMNSYGEGMGDGRLLVEWGFVGEEFAGDGVVWEISELGGTEAVGETWRGLIAIKALSPSDSTAPCSPGEEEHQDLLIFWPSKGDSRSMNMSQSGQLSIDLFAYVYLLTTATTRNVAVDKLGAAIFSTVAELEMVRRRLQDDELAGPADPVLSIETSDTVRAIIRLIDSRSARMHRPDLSTESLFEMRDLLPGNFKLQLMAMTVAINERMLLNSVRENWTGLLGR